MPPYRDRDRGAGFGPAPPSNVTRWRGVLAEPRQPSFDGSGPDRLSPHRRPAMRATLEETLWPGFTPIRLTWTPSVVSSRAPRLEKPMPQGARAPLPRSPGNGSATGRTGSGLEFPSRACSREARGPLPACAVRALPGPLHALPRDGEGRSAGSKVSSIQRSTSAPAGSARKPEQRPWPAGGWTSIHRLFPSCGKGARAFLSSRGIPCSDGAGLSAEAERERTIGSRSRYVWSAFEAPPELLRSGRSAAR